MLSPRHFPQFLVLSDPGPYHEQGVHDDTDGPHVHLVRHLVMTTTHVHDYMVIHTKRHPPDPTTSRVLHVGCYKRGVTPPDPTTSRVYMMTPMDHTSTSYECPDPFDPASTSGAM